MSHPFISDFRLLPERSKSTAVNPTFYHVGRHVDHVGRDWCSARRVVSAQLHFYTLDTLVRYML